MFPDRTQPAVRWGSSSARRRRDAAVPRRHTFIEPFLLSSVTAQAALGQTQRLVCSHHAQPGPSDSRALPSPQDVSAVKPEASSVLLDNFCFSASVVFVLVLVLVVL